MTRVSLLAARGLLILVMGACALPQNASPADTVNPSLFQLQHTSWTERDGAPPAINGIAQAPDGSLWLGSGEGLYRFDGFTFERVRAIDGDAPAPTEVNALLATSNGSLWIGTNYSGAILLRNGVATRFPKFEGLPLNTSTWSFADDLDGTIWMSTPLGLQRFDGTQWRSVGKAWGLPEMLGWPVLRSDSSGTLWAEATGHHLFRLKRDLHHFEQLADFPQELLPFTQSPSGEFWAATSSGICSLAEVLSGVAGPHCVVHYKERATPSIHEYRDLFFDPRGNLWMMSLQGDGIERLDAAAFHDAFRPGHPDGKLESFTQRDGLTSDRIRCVYRDPRDGSIWVGTDRGLDHFRESSFLPALLQPAGDLFGIQAQKDGRVWIGSTDKAGLWVASPEGKTERITGPEGIQSLYETSRGTVWFATYLPSGGVSIASLRDGPDHGKPTDLPLTPELHSQVAVQSIVEDAGGAVWASFLPYGLAKWERGYWTKNGGLAGLPDAWVVILNMGPDGRLWAGYLDGEAAVIDGTSVRRYTAKDLNIGPVAAILSGQSNSWLAGPNGLVRFDGQRFHPLLEANNRPFSGITGIAEARNGDLWLNAFNGVRRVSAAELKEAEKNPAYAVHSDLYDLTDGLPSAPQRTRPFPTAVSSPDGRIWFGFRAGVVSVDPEDPSLSTPAPPVSIVRAIADGKSFDATDAKLAARTKNLEIDYSAVSLSRANRVRFRYRLEGVDASWRDAASRRQAFYNDLPPGKFRFVVSASNGDNLWNETGAIMNLEVPPAFNQTTWFRALCVVGFFALLWALYRYRLYQIRHAYDTRLEERVGERTRIARELHDTLLQGFQGHLFHLQAVFETLPTREAGKQMLGRAIDQAAEAIGEGRDAVQDLRTSATVTNDLALALNKLGQEVAAAQAKRDAPAFHVEAGDAPRDLHPVVRDEVYRIAGEALRNAFWHSEAQNIEMDIRYEERQLRVRVRDDGKGFDPKILGDDGREGHYGVQGMRERAKLLGGKLTLSSLPDSGTEVELIIPAAHAYTPSPARRWSRLAMDNLRIGRFFSRR